MSDVPPPTLDPALFTSHTVALDGCDAAAIADAFRELPRRGSITVACPLTQSQQALAALEHAGFFALHMEAGSAVYPEIDLLLH